MAVVVVVIAAAAAAAGKGIARMGCCGCVRAVVWGRPPVRGKKGDDDLDVTHSRYNRRACLNIFLHKRFPVEY